MRRKDDEKKNEGEKRRERGQYFVLCVLATDYCCLVPRRELERLERERKEREAEEMRRRVSLVHGTLCDVYVCTFIADHILA